MFSELPAGGVAYMASAAKTLRSGHPRSVTVSAGDQGGPLTNGATHTGSTYSGDVAGLGRAQRVHHGIEADDRLAALVISIGFDPEANAVDDWRMVWPGRRR